MSETNKKTSTKDKTETKPKVAKTKKTGEDDKEKMSRSKRAAITFPVSRIERLLRDGRYAPRVESNAPVYLAAVLEYLVIEILELAHNICSQNKKTRITPQHINWAVGNDAELNHLFSNVTIANGGVVAAPTPATEKKTKKVTKKKSSASAEGSQTY
ncbi:histone H2A [Cavenderia fasciculata]|uniref:Histone H2A n=1 Tax=Cavenderia fasciculata TaxID=261658 RepID=F4QCB1_CACFS|nr:histone H2A [Cavenderia fasciculata]EGG14392.1 histone H2A [Cavenderia fasciculata]|eukprot:XP_004353801.1 histone H2A [Cavenderia fasciculata]